MMMICDIIYLAKNRPLYGERHEIEVMEEFTMPMHMGFRWYGEGNDAI